MQEGGPTAPCTTEGSAHPDSGLTALAGNFLTPDLLDHAFYRSFAYFPQSLVYTVSQSCTGFEKRQVQLLVQIIFKLLNREQRYIRLQQVPFVILQHQWHLPDRESFVAQVLKKVVQAFDVLVLLHPERIGDENDSVNSSQNKFSRRVVHHLARHRIELDSNGHVEDLADI